MAYLATPLFGIFISLSVFLIGQYLFKVSHNFFLFQPLFVGTVLGIIVLLTLAPMFHMSLPDFYLKAYKPGGDLIFFFLNPATIAFAIPLYQKRDVIRKYWLEILGALIVGLFIAMILIYGLSRLMGLNNAETASMLPMAATTAIALPLSSSIGGIASFTALACIINAVIIYALGKQFIKWFHLTDDPIPTGLGLGASGHTIGSALALELGQIQGAMAAISVVLVGIATNILVPILAQLFHLK